jgi:hypothetical protein
MTRAEARERPSSLCDTGTIQNKRGDLVQSLPLQGELSNVNQSTTEQARPMMVEGEKAQGHVNWRDGRLLRATR